MRNCAKICLDSAAFHRLLAMLACGLLLSCSSSEPQGFDFKIAVAGDGMVRVDFDDLVYTGTAPPIDQLSLTERGKELDFEVHDGGDGRFGPGDSLVFPGRHLWGDDSWFDPWSDENIYRLRFYSKPPGFEPAESVPLAVLAPQPAPEDAVFTRHFENEEIRLALPQTAHGPIETWHWQRLSHLDAEPFLLALPEGPAPVGIRVALAGLSSDQAATAAGMPQHRVELSLNGHVIATKDWDGQAAAELVADTAALAAAPGQSGGSMSQLQLRVPQRQAAGLAKPLIDVVLLNWIEIDYRKSEMTGSLTISGPNNMGHYLTEPGTHAPRWIKPYRETGLRTQTDAVDYLMISHASLLDALAPLAEFHRQRGLRVLVIDVEHIYNEFNDGIVSPIAIRDFIRHAIEHRNAPAASHVLLVGDASWDVRGEGERNLLPSMLVQAHDELAASDNGFVSIQGDDVLPDLAIGRIPAANPSELAAVVQKLLAYASTPLDEPWLRQAALVSDADEIFQDISNQLAVGLTAHGLAVNTVFPGAVQQTALQDQQDLIRSFDNGQLLVHFLGHGGRFVWRTGPLDFKNASDLFTLADVQGLQNASRLPLVLSMTCSSGPFDHPEASSIAEAFLLLPGNGAMGVLAASWRVPASHSFSTLLLNELMQPGQSIGEAILKAKRKEPRHALVESYNFFGDPALELRLPGMGPEGRLQNQSSQGQEFGGQVPNDGLQPAKTTIAKSAGTHSGTMTQTVLKPKVIRWSTASEHDSFGYDIYRGLSADGPFSVINSEVIPGAGTTDMPSSYEFSDTDIEAGMTYWYYIESISLQGERKRITPIYPSNPATE